MIHIHLSNEPFEKISGKPGDQSVLSMTLLQQEGEAALCELNFTDIKKIMPWCAIKNNDDLLFIGHLVTKQDQANQTCRATYRAFSSLPKAPDHLPHNSLFFKEHHTSQYLEASPFLFYFDRCTGKPELSHLEYGKQHTHLTEILGLTTRVSHTPLEAIEGSVEVEWTQQHEGLFDLMPSIEAVCHDGQLNTWTPQTVIHNWPKEGAFLSTRKGKSKGYAVVESYINPIPFSSSLTRIKGHIWIDWKYKQKRREILKFRLHQKLDSAWMGQTTTKKLTWKLQAVDDPENPVIPFTEPSFFNTEQGKKAAQYAQELAQHHLQISTRCLETILTVPFYTLKNITLDTTAIWEGTKKGKVTGYYFVYTAQRSWGKVVVKQSTHSQMLHSPKSCKIIKPKGMLENPPHSLVEKVAVINDAPEQEEHIKQGGQASDVPTKIFIKLAKLGQKETLLEMVSLEN